MIAKNVVNGFQVQKVLKAINLLTLDRRITIVRYVTNILLHIITFGFIKSIILEI